MQRANKKRSQSSPGSNTTSLPNAVIYKKIFDAIWEHRLLPGTKLTEEKLSAIFGISRTRVRQILSQLAYESVIRLVPNRGAFVASPTVEEAREVFETRKIIEPVLVDRLARTAKPADIARLRAHVRKETAARTANDRQSIIKLSGEFHLIMADMIGNTILSKLVRELASLTCLTIALYDSPSITACPHNEHSELIDAIEAHDSKAAAKRMIAHLEHVEAELSLEVPDKEVDLEAVFA